MYTVLVVNSSCIQKYIKPLYNHNKTQLSHRLGRALSEYVKVEDELVHCAAGLRHVVDLATV